MSLDLSALYARYRRGLVARLMRVLRSREAAEDIAQDSFAALLQASRKQDVEFPAAFLHRTAANLAINAIKHNQVITAHADASEEQDEAGVASAETVAGDQELTSRLRAALSELPPRCRDVFVLRRIHGLSQQEVAERLGISESVVKKHIVRGMEHLRRRLGRDF